MDIKDASDLTMKLSWPISRRTSPAFFPFQPSFLCSGEEDAIVSNERKSRSHVHMPHPGMIDHPGTHFDEPSDDPFNRGSHRLAEESDLPDEMQDAVGKASHKEPGLIGHKAVAARFIPPEGVLSLLDPCLDLGSAVVDQDDVFGFQPRVGDDKAYAGEKLSLVPLNLADHPPWLAPTPRLIGKFNHSHLDAPLGIGSGGWTQMRQDKVFENDVAPKTNEEGNVLALTKIIEFGGGKGGIGPEPHLPEPGAVALEDRGEHPDHSIARGDVAGPELGREKISVSGEAKERVVALFLVVAVEGGPLLLPVDRIIGGVDIEDDPVLVPCHQERIGGCAKSRLKGLDPLFGCKNIVFKPTKRRLTRPRSMPLTQGEPQGRIHSERVGIIAVFVSRGDLVSPLAQELQNRVIGVGRRSFVLEPGGDGLKKPATLIDFPAQEHAAIRRNRGSLKVDRDGPIEPGPDCLPPFTTQEHATPPLDYDFFLFYQRVETDAACIWTLLMNYSGQKQFFSGNSLIFRLVMGLSSFPDQDERSPEERVLVPSPAQVGPGKHQRLKPVFSFLKAGEETLGEDVCGFVFHAPETHENGP